MRNILFGLMLSAGLLPSPAAPATGAKGASDDLSKAVRNAQDLLSWKASMQVQTNGKTANLDIQWTGTRMILDVTSMQNKRYFAMYEKGKSFLSADRGKTWEPDDTKVAEQQLTLILAAMNWDGKGTLPGSYDWAGAETIDGEKTTKIAGTGVTKMPTTFWIYDHPRYGKTVKKTVTSVPVSTETTFLVTVTFREPSTQPSR